ncbi:hypothetical protein CMV_012034 [Castanea mollissima]|uniref:Uncharacterized protein n=1 Tax=Castanea mollissima TaxID=60419 RepID=A0A8J4RBS8_9ROSI|nr:hypothetical protein CMV_012034 [Castanea mollissima]
MDSNCFSILEVKYYCAELGVLDYDQFYFLVLGLDLNMGLRYLSTNANTQELFKDVSVINAANLVSCGVGVEDVDVDDVDGDGDDNEVDVEGGDEALADDEFKESGNLVDEGNGVMGDVDYEWYDSDYNEPTNEKLYEITLDEVDGNTFQPTITHNGQPSQEPILFNHPVSHHPNFANQSLSHLDLVLTLFDWRLDEISSGSNYASSDELHSPDNSNGKQKKKLLQFKLEYLNDPKFVLGMSFKNNKSFHRRQVYAHWVAEKYIDQFQTNTYFQATDLVAAVEQDVNVELALSKAYRARNIARGMVRGDFCEQYSKVRCYCAALRRSNSSTIAKVTIVVPSHNFKRGVVTSQLLAIVGIGGNNDQQEGLLPDLADVFLDAYNRFCVRHLFDNFKKNHQGKELKDLMWGGAKSSTRVAFESYMKQMEIVSKEACDELRGRNAFPYYPKCDMLLNNVCETFNSNIVEAREKPLVNMLETIRRYLMVRICKNMGSMAKYQGPICHKIQQKFEKCIETSIDCKSIWSSGMRWEHPIKQSTNIEENLKRSKTGVDGSQQSCRNFNSHKAAELS